MCCTRLAANAGPKKVAKNRHLGTIPQLCQAISSQLRHVSTIGKNLLSSNISPTCPHNMVNFGPLAAEIVSLAWGTPGNFSGFLVLAALLHGTLAVGVTYIQQGGHHVGHWPTFLVNYTPSTPHARGQRPAGQQQQQYRPTPYSHVHRRASVDVPTAAVLSKTLL